jgi:hypothetical protein
MMSMIIIGFFKSTIDKHIKCTLLSKSYFFKAFWEKRTVCTARQNVNPRAEILI